MNQAFGTGNGTALGSCITIEASDELARAAERQDRERQRVHELLRYFQPFQTPACSEDKPRVATDQSLTAFAQLAALRLNCQRAFISLIDHTKQYIVAEATQTISLQSEDVYENDDDRLSFGQTVLDFATGVCPGTIACFTSPDNSLDVATEFVRASRSYYVMNDMSQLETYKSRPYISGWPHMRFYAEVPINSPSGICIGTICVVDNKAREGLDMEGIRTLQEISSAVMDHLELCVSKVQQNRAERMIQALGQFVEGNASVRDAFIEAQAARLSAPGMRHLSVEKLAEIELGPEPADLQVMRRGNLLGNVQSSQDSQQLQQSNGQEDADEEVYSRLTDVQVGPTAAKSISIPEDISSDRNTLSQDKTSQSINVTAATSNGTEDKSSGVEDNNKVDMLSTSSDSPEGVLLRAANLIREGIGLDGVVFFDPCSTNGQALDISTTPTKEAANQPSMGQSSHQNRNVQGISLENDHKISKVMSYSTKMRHQHNCISMSEKTLQVLLKLFPLGGLLTLDSQGILGADYLTPMSGGSKATCYDGISAAATRRGSLVDNSEIPDDELRRIFPGVTSLMIYPFWNNVLNKCVAHCIAWTSDSARVFQRQDFTYVASFGNSIIAELSRIETVAADKAKSTFISSISHELRSPLHGIMASMEILRDLTTDDSYNDLFSTIESCGSTLLDTIDNVLAFSRSSMHIKDDGKLISRAIGNNEGGSISAIDLEILVEEVTSICLNGVQFRKTVDASSVSSAERLKDGHKNTSKVMVICDIIPGYDWLFETNAAVWKRILLNLVGNALKYTSNGFIIVTLRQEMTSDAQQSKSSTVTLTVKDSGKGMSLDYLAHYLFKPFYQENPLAPGTGLGLSIVKRLVLSLGGTINVSSEEGVGTEITVEVPLKQVQSPSGNSTTNKPQSEQSTRLGVFGLNAIPDLEITPTGILPSRSQALLALNSTLSSYAAASSLVTTTVASVDSPAADILIFQDSQYRLLQPSEIIALRKPVIVICMEPLRGHEHKSGKPKNVTLLPNPFGPRKFKRIVESCLRIRREILESAPVELLQVKAHPPRRNSVIVPRISHNPNQAGNVVNTPAADIGQSRPFVLLVEDNPINLKLLVTSVNRMGYPFMTATNGVEAVEAYTHSSTEVRIVFMDIQMPIMDGIAASREIRSYEKKNALPRTVIVALTALGSHDAKQACKDSGVDFFFTKPVSVKKVKEIVAEHYV